VILLSTQDLTVPTSLAARVRAGVAYLDRNKPGWHELVIPEALSMASSCNCVLGQVYGNFFDVQEVLFGDDFVVQTARLGFDADAEGTGPSEVQFAALKRLWSFVIRQRLAVPQ